ncbi:cupin domain-containing protein [Natrinema sp. 1APR25-10V2]|uniref:cupin domain-containing protein n=1 Tax=Natrinema sp. 1APR25-10V2 TaxID=2951081 RepID=UPI0028762B21|nr:cupin domain-containing protein [Natrinema sp. 1APR25-10V2]MDS0476876.1 cupin domain-containing protein [Natrinema sp. 1APR25-10V2]
MNPQVKETFQIISGGLQVVAGDQEYLLTDGDKITISGKHPHRHWNPSDRPARICYEARPAIHMDEALETAFVLAQAGKADEHGNPDLLPLAVFQDAYPDHFYSTDLPIIVQKLLFKVLAPIGRLAGYRPTYSREDIADLR